MGRFNLIISVLFGLGLLAQGSLLVLAQNVAPNSRAGQQAAINTKLDTLFSNLKQAASEAQARVIEAEIWQHWSKSGVSSIDRLMNQAKLLAARGYYEPSLSLLARVIYEQPKYSEGWNRKATVLFFMMRDDESLVAIKKVLALEPRHFGALAGKAMIKMRGEKWAEALEVLRQAVKIHPYLKERHFITFLERKLNVRDL